jgi:lipopolysaccharide export system permease protein
LTGFQSREKHIVNPMRMRLYEIPSARQNRYAEIQRLEQQLAVDSAIAYLMGDFDDLTGASWTERLRWLDSQRQYLHRLDVEPYRRWSGGFSCLAFVLVGAPLAIRLRTADLMTTFGICFLPILLVYYPLFACGLDRAKDGVLPPYCVWLGNLICALIGGWLLRWVARH